MQRNVGHFDRLIRALLGATILITGIYFESWWGLLGLVFLGTAAMGWCPLYEALHVSTYHGHGTRKLR